MKLDEIKTSVAVPLTSKSEVRQWLYVVSGDAAKDNIGWPKKHNTVDEKFVINDDLSVEVKSSISIHVDGYGGDYVGGNHISKVQIPKLSSVGDSVSIWSMPDGSKSFNFMPSEVLGNVIIRNSKLTVMKGLPKEIGGNFEISFYGSGQRKIPNLIGMPREISGNIKITGPIKMKSAEGICVRANTITFEHITFDAGAFDNVKVQGNSLKHICFTKCYVQNNRISSELALMQYIPNIRKIFGENLKFYIF